MPRETRNIQKIYAFVSEASGEEGIISGVLPGLGLSPFVSTYEHNLPGLELIAQGVADKSKAKVTLIEMSARRDVKVLEPR